MCPCHYYTFYVLDYPANLHVLRYLYRNKNRAPTFFYCGETRYGMIFYGKKEKGDDGKKKTKKIAERRKG